MLSWQTFCSADRCIQPSKVCNNRTRQLGVFGSYEGARAGQLQRLQYSSNHYMEKRGAQKVVDAASFDYIVAFDADSEMPIARPTTARSRSRSPGSHERSLRRSISSFNSRFDSVMGSLVRSEQAALSAERVALAAAEAFSEEAKVLKETIATITSHGKFDPAASQNGGEVD